MQAGAQTIFNLIPELWQEIPVWTCSLSMFSHSSRLLLYLQFPLYSRPTSLQGLEHSRSWLIPSQEWIKAKQGHPPYIPSHTRPIFLLNLFSVRQIPFLCLAALLPDCKTILIHPFLYFSEARFFVSASQDELTLLHP